MGTAFDIRDEYPFFSTTFLYPTEPECSHRSLSPLLTQQNTDINYQQDIHRNLEFKNFVSISIIYHNGNIWGIVASERAQPGKSEPTYEELKLFPFLLYDFMSAPFVAYL